MLLVFLSRPNGHVAIQETAGLGLLGKAARNTQTACTSTSSKRSSSCSYPSRAWERSSACVREFVCVHVPWAQTGPDHIYGCVYVCM